MSNEERTKFKGITVLEGFIFSDNLSTIPFKKPIYLDGLAIDFVFKKYIILNPRVFAWGSDDYTRFVLFHELCHIKKHDSSSVFLVLISIAAVDLLIPLLPIHTLYFSRTILPYYDYILTGAAVLYILLVVSKNKNKEKRADSYGIEAIGPDGCTRVYEKTGISLKNRIE